MMTLNVGFFNPFSYRKQVLTAGTHELLYQDVSAVLMVFRCIETGGFVTLMSDTIPEAMQGRAMLTVWESRRMLYRWLDDTYFKGLGKQILGKW